MTAENEKIRISLSENKLAAALRQRKLIKQESRCFACKVSPQIDSENAKKQLSDVKEQFIGGIITNKQTKALNM